MRKEVPSSDHPMSASVSGLSTIFQSLARKAGTLPVGCCGMMISITGSWFILDPSLVWKCKLCFYELTSFLKYVLRISQPGYHRKKISQNLRA